MATMKPSLSPIADVTEVDQDPVSGPHRAPPAPRLPDFGKLIKIRFYTTREAKR